MVDFELVNEKMQRRGLAFFRMDEALLLHCVESYFLDIRRLKSFHPIKRADRFKMAGFLVKWLAKTKPIQVIGDFQADGSGPGLEVLTINARFAVMQGLHIARIDSAALTRLMKMPKSGRVEDQAKALVETMIYSCMYRDFDPQAWVMIFISLHHSFPKEGS